MSETIKFESLSPAQRDALRVAEIGGRVAWIVPVMSQATTAQDRLLDFLGASTHRARRGTRMAIEFHVNMFTKRRGEIEFISGHHGDAVLRGRTFDLVVLDGVTRGDVIRSAHIASSGTVINA